MDIITVNGSRVIQCPHCAGSGMCRFSHLAQGQQKHSSGGMFPSAVLQCQRCGLGPFRYLGVTSGGGLKTPTLDEMTPPICKICDGKGFNAI